MAISTTEVMQGLHRPFFTPEQLIMIYEATDRSVDKTVLQAKAQELFPDVLDEGKPPISVTGPFGRWFDLGDGHCGPAKYTIVSNASSAVGVLDDGTPKSF